MNLTWIPSVSASSFYAVWQIHVGQLLVSEKLAEALAQPTRMLIDVISEAGAAPGQFFDVLLPASANIESNHELARFALTKTLGRECADTHSLRVAGVLGDVERAVHRHAPRLQEELALREQPLRMQWEAQGPGLLYSLSRITDPEFLVADARVALVMPVLGGGGWAHPRFNQVTFEAVLTNIVPHLPEVLRLAWLLAHLHLDLPRYSECLSPSPGEHIGSLALIPMLLHCGEQLDICSCTSATIAAAMTAWCADGGQQASRAATVYTWWQTYLGNRPSVGAALMALEQMLHT
jgi:hypothetical protein